MRMHRRTLLKSMAAALALQPLAGVAFSLKAAGLAARVRPGDPAWPGPAAWSKLKAAVGGNLIDVQAPFAACAADAKGPFCADALKNMHNPFWVGDQPGGTQVSGWYNAWTPAPSVYAIKARNTADIVAGVNFARANNLRLVVKGTGHSYLGTSNAPDSLLIWTRGMNKVTVHDGFVPKGSSDAPVPAVSAEAGAIWIDLYHAVTEQAGRYVQGGGCTDVGVAGLVQGGGFGSFSKGFGTGGANLIEAEIVTADGEVRIVNANSEAELFWALKGGGGGTFGIVTRFTLRTHALPNFLGFGGGKIKAHSDAAYKRLIEQFLGFYRESLFNPHWGEEVHFHPDNSFEISMVCQGLSPDQAKAAWQPFFDWVIAAPQDYTEDGGLRANAWPAKEWWDVPNNPSMIPDPRPGAPSWHGWWQGDQGQVGAYLHGYESLWLPQALLKDDRKAQLADAIFAASRYKEVQFHFNKGIAGAPPEAIAATLQTPMNPKVVDAFTLALIADGEAPAYPGPPGASIDLKAAKSDARAIDLAAAELRKIAPNSGSYFNETNYFNANWHQDYWGENYPKLHAIKNKYDPGGLFFVHHGVGSEDWSADGFTRVG
jgi:FAD/FMN-containing dehydrogenase